MANSQKLSIALTDQQADMLREAVDSGDYANVNDVVDDAMRLWQERRLAKQTDVEKLREMWDAGKASGAPQPIDFQELQTEARRKLAEVRRNAR